MSDPTRKYLEKTAKSGGDDALSPFQQVQNWFDGINSSDYDGHDASIVRLLKLESATFAPTSNNPNNSRNVMSFTVPRQLCNMGGSLHGGAVALIFDITTSMAITPCVREGFWDRGHVSRNLNTTYLRPAAEGTKVFVESWVEHLGKRLAQTRGVMRLESEDGKICYTCEHGKVSLGSSGL